MEPKPSPTQPPSLTIDDFIKIELRVGQVTAALPVPDSKKLIQLTVDFGSEIGMRTVLTGLLSYFPDMSHFIGNKFIFLTNLAPRTMAGIQSQGMFLAAESTGEMSAPTLLALPPDTPVGARVH